MMTTRRSPAISGQLVPADERAANVGAVLVQQRRGRHARRARAVELHGRPDGLLAAVRTLDRHDQAEMPHLRILHDLVDAIDRRERHVVRAEALDPVLQRVTRELRVERRTERLVVVDAPLPRAEALVAADRRRSRARSRDPPRTSRATRDGSRSGRRRRCAGCTPARAAADRWTSALDRARRTRRTARRRSAPSLRASRLRRVGRARCGCARTARRARRTPRRCR